MATEQNLETRIAVIENEFSSIYNMSSRFERALDKLTEVSSSLKEMLAVHESKLKEHDKTDTMLLKSMADHKSEYEDQVEHLNQRVEKMGDELRQQIKSEIVSYGAIIKEGMADLKLSHQRFLESHQLFVKEMEQRFKEINESHTKKIERLEDRLAKLEHWRWLLIGGALVIGVLGDKWDAIAKFFVG